MTKSCKTLVKVLVDNAICDNMIVSVNDGEEWVVKFSNNVKEIMDALNTTEDGDLLVFRDADDKGQKIGWIQLIWDGMEGMEVFADWSDNDAINALVDWAELQIEICA